MPSVRPTYYSTASTSTYELELGITGLLYRCQGSIPIIAIRFPISCG
jgi:hypothetical protein